MSPITSRSMDCVSRMTHRNGVDVMTTRELFDFVTRHTLKEEDYDTYIQNVGVVGRCDA